MPPKAKTSASAKELKIIEIYLQLVEESLAKYGENTVVFYQVGEFYEVYGLKDHPTEGYIRRFTAAVELNVANKNATHPTLGLPILMAGHKTTFLDKYLRILNQKGYTSVVYSQLPNDPTTRVFQEVCSPGTFFDTATDDGGDSRGATNKVMVIWLEPCRARRTAKTSSSSTATTPRSRTTLTIGCGCVDVNTGQSMIHEYTVPEFSVSTGTTPSMTMYDDLEQFYSIQRPIELVIIAPFKERTEPKEKTDLIPKKHLEELLKYLSTEQISSSVRLVSSCVSDRNTSERYASEEKGSISAPTLSVVSATKQVFQTEYLRSVFDIADYASFYQSGFLGEYPVATQAYVYGLQFIQTRNPSLLRHLTPPTLNTQTNRHLILSTHSLKQLNIISSSPEENSLMKILNKCVTAMGRRLFEYHLTHPEIDVDRIEHSYDAIDVALHHYNLEAIRIELGGVRDLMKLYRKIVLRKIRHDELFRVIEILTTIDQVMNMCDASKSRREMVNELKTLLSETLTEESFVSGYHSELDEALRLRDESIAKLTEIAVELSTLIPVSKGKGRAAPKNKTSGNAVDVSTLPVKLVYTGGGTGVYLTSTEPRAKKLLEALSQVDATSTAMVSPVSARVLKRAKGLKIERVSTSTIRLVSAKISEYANNFERSYATIETLHKTLFLEFLERLDGYRDHLVSLSDYIAHIDVITTKAWLAKKYKYVRPTVTKRGTHLREKGRESCSASYIKATGLRHAIIERLVTDELYVSNDISLGGGRAAPGPSCHSPSSRAPPTFVESSRKGMLLMGVNATGKSSLIRSIGVAIVMAQAGMFVPADSFEYSPYTSIFTRILGNDDLFRGLSTFMVEMSELRTILMNANERSLVLGDELCSGTETSSAISIFVTGLQHLLATSSTFVFATHLHEIVEMDEVVKMTEDGGMSIKHLSVRYDPARDLLIYDRKLKDGPGSSVYGLEVCRALSLPTQFLEDANTLRNKYFSHVGRRVTNVSNDDGTGNGEGRRRGDGRDVVDKPSRYNAKKLVGKCEICGQRRGTDTHHLRYQSEADPASGLIGSFHKNHVANLANVCEECHRRIHDSDTRLVKRKTTAGVIIEETRV